jgi:hypothetical protein
MSVELENIRAAIDQLQQKKQAYDTALKACDEAIRRLEIVLAELAPALNEMPGATGNPDVEQRQLSYVQLAIRVLEELGRPAPITVLLERIRERRNDPTITRGSVETSLLRYLTAKGEDADVIKPCPGTYALRWHSKSENLATAQHA